MVEPFQHSSDAYIGVVQQNGITFELLLSGDAATFPKSIILVFFSWLPFLAPASSRYDHFDSPQICNVKR